MPRKILHLDLDAFFCAVEELRDPGLAGQPFAVGGSPDERGVVASCSYAARQFGVHSAMPMSRALRLCPGLSIVSSRHEVYSQVSRQVMKRLNDFSPLVEQISIDEAFIDISDLPDPPEIVASHIQARIRAELSLPCSLGAASNKLVAKIANDFGKQKNRSAGTPNAITVVQPGEEAAFLAPLPVQALWGVGPKTGEILEGLEVRTIGDLARWSSADLERRFGKLGVDLSQRARGIDDRPVVNQHETRSISQEVTFGHDIQAEEILHQTLHKLSEGVGRRLRAEGLWGHTVRLKLRWPDFTTITRQTRLEIPTGQDSQIYNAALELFQNAWRPGQPVRLLGVAVSGLERQARQLSLWDGEAEKERRLLRAVDELHSRFGETSVQRGGRLKKQK